MNQFGDGRLLQRARALCYEIEKLPAGQHQTELSMRAAQIASALQSLQSTGKCYWPDNRIVVYTDGKPIERYTDDNAIGQAGKHDGLSFNPVTSDVAAPATVVGTHIAEKHRPAMQWDEGCNPEDAAGYKV